MNSSFAQIAADLLNRTVTENPYIPALAGTFPSMKQAIFLTAPCDEILYGGAAGGGKSAGILASALQYVGCPGYDAIIFRRSFSDLEKPGGLIPLSYEWLGRTNAKYDGTQHRWYFPSGATVSFGFITNDREMIQDFQGSAFGFVGFDELTQFTEYQYRYMFSRRRKPVGTPFPIRTRATSNPGGTGHEWVKARFVDGSDGVKRLFIPALLVDNPGLDRAEYEASLDMLDPLTRAQLKAGDWNVRPEGTMFKREWFAGKYIDPNEVPHGLRRVRYWDLAATKLREDRKNDPDWCAGCLGGADENNNVYVMGMEHLRDTPLETERRVMQTAGMDGTDVSIRIELEPGASAKLYVASLAQRALPAYDVSGFPTNGQDKITRAKPFSAACQRGNVYIVRGEWNAAWIDELCVAKGSLVSTIRGDIPIESILVGDRVLTRAGWKRVTQSRQTNPQARVMELTTAMGRKLLATHNHPVWSDSRFLKMSHLRVGDGLQSTIAALDSISIQNQRSVTSPLASKGNTPSFTDTFGFRKLARFLMDITSTTKTRIQQTTSYGIFGAFLRRIISGFTPEALLLQSCGQPSVSYAGRFTQPLNSDARKHALRSAGISCSTPTATKRFIRSDVRNAERLSPTDTPRLNSVADDAVLTIKSVERECPVYNLEVEGCHEYFANGILVHNCAFPAVAHDDQVDAATGMYNSLFSEPEIILIGGSFGDAVSDN